MPSQSRWDGESTPVHLIWTESPDLVRILGVNLMEIDEMGVTKKEMEKKKKRKVERDAMAPSRRNQT